mgnify:FL=1
MYLYRVRFTEPNTFKTMTRTATENLCKDPNILPNDAKLVDELIE